ncbi:hypothetical protein [Streptomyces sp. YIM S03343]
MPDLGELAIAALAAHTAVCRSVFMGSPAAAARRAQAGAVR